MILRDSEIKFKRDSKTKKAIENWLQMKGGYKIVYLRIWIVNIHQESGLSIEIHRDEDHFKLQNRKNAMCREIILEIQIDHNALNISIIIRTRNEQRQYDIEFGDTVTPNKDLATL